MSKKTLRLLRLRRAGPHPWLALGALLFLAVQTAITWHLIDHTLYGNNAGCELCIAAGYLGTGIPPGAAAQPPRPPVAPDLRALDEALPDLSPLPAYQSRAPPASPTT